MLKTFLAPSKIKSYLPSVLFILLIAFAWIITYRYFQPTPEPAIRLDTLNELQKKSIEIVIEMNKLMISLSLLVIGGIGGFLLQKYQVIKIRSIPQKIIIVFSIVFSALAIYFGYLIYSKMVETLANNIFALAGNLIDQFQKYQYYSFLLSLILFGLFVINETTHSMNGKSNETDNG